MKILHVLESIAPVGGAEGFAHEAVAALSQARHENRIVYRLDHRRLSEPDSQLGYHVPWPEYPADVTGAKRTIAEVVDSERPDVAFVHTVYHPAIVEAVAELLPTVAYVQGPYLVCPGHRQYLWRRGYACPHTAGAICLWNAWSEKCMWGRNPLSHLEYLRRTKRLVGVYRTVSQVIVGSRFMRRLMLRAGLPAGSVAVLPTILTRLTGQGRVDVPTAGSATVLFVGRIVPEKGLDHLLRALAQVSTPWRLTVVGAGADQARCTELAAGLGILNRVDFTGWVDGERLAEYYSDCAVLVMPSLWPEPFGRTGPEAMASGKPAVAYASGGIPDWLEHGRNGLLVAPGNIDGLALAIDSLLSDPARRAEMGAYGRQFVLERFGAEKQVTQLIEILERAQLESRKEPIPS